MHDAAAAASTTTVKGKPRKITLDQKMLHSVIASHPYTADEVRTDKAKLAEVKQWERPRRLCGNMIHPCELRQVSVVQPFIRRLSLV